jgi:pimeloyl-ACP methyl ester carboxylesterase
MQPTTTPTRAQTRKVSQNENPIGRHATVNGIDLYYEVHGEGSPLVVLHGAIGASEMFGPLVPALARERQVIAVHLQGHGHTPDVDRPLRLELMADDIAALVRHLGLRQVDLVGYSLGAGVALRTAFQHPDLVHRLVVVSETYRRDGWYPEVLAAMDRMGPHIGEGMKHSPLAKIYPGVDWPALFSKMHDLVVRDYDWTGEVAALKARTMLVFGDADAVRPAHVVEFFGLLGGGKKDGGLDGSGRPSARLAILPGATHYDILSSPVLAPAVSAFLREG